MLAIYKKELRSYFTSVIGFIFLGFFLAIVGLYCLVINLLNEVGNFSYVLSGVSFLFILLVPILTMRIIAEENRQKTDQLLYTSPVSIEKIVMGKFLAVTTLFGIGMLVVSLYPLMLIQFGDIDLAVSYSSVLGFTLMGASYLAIGMFISSLTESQVIAAVISFVVMLFTYLMTSLVGMLPKDNLAVWLMTSFIILFVSAIVYFMVHNMIISAVFAVIAETALAILYFMHPSFYDGLLINILSWFSVSDRFHNFSIGILDVTALIYYLSVCFIFVYLTILNIKKKRWS